MIVAVCCNLMCERCNLPSSTIRRYCGCCGKEFTLWCQKCDFHQKFRSFYNNHPRSTCTNTEHQFFQQLKLTLARPFHTNPQKLQNVSNDEKQPQDSIMRDLADGLTKHEYYHLFDNTTATSSTDYFTILWDANAQKQQTIDKLRLHIETLNQKN
jgi:hypothetical protein